MSDDERYFLKYGPTAWIEVTRENWIQAEREAGFHPKGGGEGPATGGFGKGNLIRGSIVNMKYSKPKGWDWEPGIQKLVWPDYISTAPVCEHGNTELCLDCWENDLGDDL